MAVHHGKSHAGPRPQCQKANLRRTGHLKVTAAGTEGTRWTTRECKRFKDALTLYPTGPWKLVADYVGTRTRRQTKAEKAKPDEAVKARREAARQKRLCLSVHRVLYNQQEALSLASQSEAPFVCANTTALASSTTTSSFVAMLERPYEASSELPVYAEADIVCAFDSDGVLPVSRNSKLATNVSFASEISLPVTSLSNLQDFVATETASVASGLCGEDPGEQLGMLELLVATGTYGSSAELSSAIDFESESASSTQPSDNEFRVETSQLIHVTSIIEFLKPLPSNPEELHGSPEPDSVDDWDSRLQPHASMRREPATSFYVNFPQAFFYSDVEVHPFLDTFGSHQYLV